MSNKLISVIMPSYNSAHYIGASLESVLAQTYKNWELLIIDDSSTDETKQIAKSFNDKRIRIFTQTHKGPGVARNHGIKKAKGELIAFLDSDDLWSEDKLSIQAKVFDQKKVDLVFCDGYIFGESIKTTDFNTVSGLFSGDKMLKILFERNVIGLLSVVVKKEIILKVGGFAEEGINSTKSEDYDLWLRLAKAGFSFYGLPEKLCRYRIHPNSYEHQRALRLEADAEVIEKYIDNPAISKSLKQARLTPLYKELIYLLAPTNIAKARLYQRKLARLEPTLTRHMRSWLLSLGGHFYKYSLDAIAGIKHK